MKKSLEANSGLPKKQRSSGCEDRAVEGLAGASKRLEVKRSLAVEEVQQSVYVSGFKIAAYVGDPMTAEEREAELLLIKFLLGAK